MNRDILSCSNVTNREFFCSLGMALSVCVLHIKPFFLPVDIQHTQCPCRFFLLEIYTSSTYN